MSLFTPRTGLLGGSLMGGSAGALLLLNGDIMGISGILSNTLIHPRESLRDVRHHWRWVYLASFCTAVHVHVNYFSPNALQESRAEAPDVPIPSLLADVVGGFLVGLGTRLGNGCTTGHGICGNARFSPRSFVATVTFTGCSILTRFVLSPLRPWSARTQWLRTSQNPAVSPTASALFTAAMCLIAMTRPMVIDDNAVDDKEKSKTLTKTKTTIQDFLVHSRKTFGAAISGVMFAYGLAISGMAKTFKVHDFLCLSGLSRGTYDPTLMTVLSAAIATSWLSYQFVDGYSQVFSTKKKEDDDASCLVLKRPLALPSSNASCGFSVPTSRVVDTKLLTGAMLFGMGWGTTGICPGPALFMAAAGVVNAIVAWLPAFVVGSWTGLQLQTYVESKKSKKE